MKSSTSKLLLSAFAVLAALALLVAAGVSGAYLYLRPSLPSVEAMRQIELQVPLRVYSRDGQTIAQIGEQRRIPVTFDDIPPMVRQAFVAAEDDRFFQHKGFDYQGILRSALVNLIPGSRLQGASTITMQTARNLFLTQDRTWRRKLQEVFLTYRIEQEFTKEEILGLYLNVINFGKRAYGVAAAAELYFGKSLEQLTLAEAATLARVPQAPSRYNPISNPKAAAERRGYVLRRMRELGMIDADTARRAAQEIVRARLFVSLSEVEAHYIGEMARLELVQRFGAAAQNEGYKIYTTIDPRMQEAANRALRAGLLDYDRRHGWRGARSRATLQGTLDDGELEELLDGQSAPDPLQPAVVLEVKEKSAGVYVRGSGRQEIDWEGLSWARRKNAERLGPSPRVATDVLAKGDIVHVTLEGRKLRLAQIPEAAAALVALSPNDGAILALVGGFNYFDPVAGKFNRAIQAKRQPGSGFKPFLYSAALDNGFTAASILQDSPFVIDDPRMEEAWRPENSSGDFRGPMRLREALVQSRNLVSIRLLQGVGLGPAISFIERFGFERAALPRNLTLSLGTMSATPLEVATGYAVFANGGYRIQPYFIERIEDPQGNIVFTATPRVVAPECDAPLAAATPLEALKEEAASTEVVTSAGCTRAPTEVAPRVISAQNAWIMNDMLREVITRGTGRRALALGRADLAGKTGTTNEARDTWFNGYNRSIVASVWVGFDQSQPLGAGEEGSRTAVPIWVDFMRDALREVPVSLWPAPGGLAQMRISASTGLIASADDPDAIFETFMAERMQGGNTFPMPTPPNQRPSTILQDPLF